MGRDEALAELTKRFFTSRGPATIYDFAWWSGLSVSEAKKGIEMVKNKFKRESIDGKEYFFRSPASYKNKTEAIDKKYRAVILKERNAVFTNSILINGKIEGIWKRAITNNSFIVKTRFFSKLPRTK